MEYKKSRKKYFDLSKKARRIRKKHKTDKDVKEDYARRHKLGILKEIESLGIDISNITPEDLQKEIDKVNKKWYTSNTDVVSWKKANIIN